MEQKDSWWLLTEIAKINNQNKGIDMMLDILEENKELMDSNHAQVLMDYVELLPENEQYFERIKSLVVPLSETFNFRVLYRLSVMEAMMEEKQKL